MVKPTGTSDALLSKNRFAALSSNGATGNRNPPTLTVSASAVGGAASLLTGKSRWFENTQDSPGFCDSPSDTHREEPLSNNNEQQGKNIRNRSNSTKRKNSAEDTSNAKSARIEVSDCPHLIRLLMTTQRSSLRFWKASRSTQVMIRSSPAVSSH